MNYHESADNANKNGNIRKNGNRMKMKIERERERKKRSEPGLVPTKLKGFVLPLKGRLLVHAPTLCKRSGL